jgi:hypothetical protein
VGAIIDGFLAANPDIDTRLIHYANALWLHAVGLIFGRSINGLRHQE